MDRRRAEAANSSCRACGGWRRIARGRRRSRTDRATHRAVADVTKSIEGFAFNKAVAKLYELANAIGKSGAGGDRGARRCASWRS